MKKQILFLLFVVFGLTLNAQIDTKYLQGAVRETDGKVVFTKDIKVHKQISDENLFDLMKTWAENNYKSDTENDKQRVLYADKQSSKIVCQGDKYLVFKSSTFSLDRAEMIYQLVLDITNNSCNVTIRNIKFDYNESGSKTETFPAEKMITDDIALAKNNKLNRHFDKFRIHTIDTVDEIYDSIDTYLNGKKASEGAIDRSIAEPVKIEVEIKDEPATPVATKIEVETIQDAPIQNTGSMAGFRKIEPDKIPGNYIKLLDQWTLITSGAGDNINVMTASWGGIGVLWTKPVAFCFLGPTRYSIKTMDEGDTYTISFYTEAYKENMQYCGSTSGRNTDKIKGSGLTPIKTPSGATAFSEAWMIIECRKILAQPLSKDAVYNNNSEALQKWTKGDLHKMYVGEIIGVWVK